MFNRSVYFAGDTNVKVNTVSGGIVKNHKDSYFLRFHLNSTLGEKLLSPEPCRISRIEDRDKYGYSSKIPVEVLQMVIVGDMEVVAEIIDLPSEQEAKQ